MPGNAVQKCPAAGKLFVQVRRQDDTKPKSFNKLTATCKVRLEANLDKPEDDIRNNTTFKKVCAGSYPLKLTPQGDEAKFEVTEEIELKSKTLQAETSVGVGPSQRSATISDNKTTMHYYRLYPHFLKVVVVDDTGKSMQGIDVVAVQNNVNVGRRTSDQSGNTDFGYVKKGQITLSVARENLPADQFQVLLPSSQGAADGIVNALRVGEGPYRIVITPIIRIYLRLVFKDPENNERNFPKDFPLNMNFDAVLPEGTASKRVKVRDNGIVGSDGHDYVEVPRAALAFTLNFQQGNARYIVCEKVGAAAKTQALTEEGDLDMTDLSAYRAFLLPRGRWTQENSDWTVTGAATYQDASKKFDALRNPQTAVGAVGQPVKLLLDPHWQFLRFVYYDRWLQGDKRISIPPIMAQGFLDKSAAAGPADTASNWIINADDKEFRQCLPWIIQRPSLTKPDDKVLLQFETPADTFIETAADKSSRKVVSGTKHDTPEGERLRFYDLPLLWKSQKYYCRLGAGGTVAKEDRCEKLVAKATTADEPLIFCLDDLVLTDKDLKPITWVPNDRAAIFSHYFNKKKPDGSAVAGLTPEGVYKPDATNNQSFFTTKPDADASKPGEKDRNYIADYPDWTRLVAAKGNLFDVFDQRTTDSTPATPDDVVGARAAVCWVDATDVFAGINMFTWNAGTNSWDFQADGKPKAGRMLDPTRPPVTTQPFFVIQPYFENRFAQRYSAPYDVTKDEGGGRYEMTMIRCCDAVKNAQDPSKYDEIAVNLHYFRFSFNFTADPATDAGMGVPHKSKKEFQELIIKNVNARWNGEDTVNTCRARLVPREAGNLIQIFVTWFAQSLTSDLAHIDVKVLATTPTGRDNRGSSQGTGESQTKNYQEWNNFHTSAHECGHADTLPDEYNERWDGASYGMLSLKCNLAADPYEPDGRAVDGANGTDKPMMNTVNTMRNRYFWHCAEWARIVCGDVKFNVYYKTPDGLEYPDYYVPPHETVGRTYAFWPIEATRDYKLPAVAPFTGNRGKVDLFLYTLGKDKYAKDVLPSFENPPGATAHNGVLYFIIKFKCTLGPVGPAGIVGDDDRKNLLIAISSGVKSMNCRYYLTGRARSGDQQWDFTRAMIYISPRFLVANHSDNALVTKINTNLIPHFELDLQPGAARAAEWVVNPAAAEVMTRDQWKTASTQPGAWRNDAVKNFDSLVGGYHGVDLSDLAARYNKLQVIVDRADSYLAAAGAADVFRPSVQALRTAAEDRKQHYGRCATSEKLSMTYRAASMLDDVRWLFSKYFPGFLGIYKSPFAVTEADLKPFLTPLNLSNTPDVKKIS